MKPFLKTGLAGTCFLAAFLVLSVSCASAQVKQYSARAVAQYPHDVESYTQGLFIMDGQMYESTGEYGNSTFRKVDTATGKALRRLDFNEKYFVEGSVAMGDSLYILTWTNRVAFMYFMDRNLKVGRTVNVRLHGKPLNYLNELEYIGGKIWANVYMTNMIVIIDPESGNVESVIDCTGLLPDRLRTEDTDVLNGIAYDGSSGKIYLTGKNWPLLFEIRLEEKK